MEKMVEMRMRVGQHGERTAIAGRSINVRRERKDNRHWERLMKAETKILVMAPVSS